MRILVAGLTGQLGHGLASRAAAAGVELVPVVRPVGRWSAATRVRRTFPQLPELAGAAVAGDVTQPHWGLEPEQLDRLASDVDLVLNVAAETNWAAPARRLHQVNVVGALHGLTLARRLRERHPRCGAYVHASSVFVAGGRVGVVPEVPFGPDSQRTEYEHSKWLAEHYLLRRVAEPGAASGANGRRGPQVAVGIARIGGLLGDATTGHTAKLSSLYQLAAARHRRWPWVPVTSQGRVDMLPRDRAADALVHFALGVLRLADPRPQIAHVCAGEHAPTLRSVLAAFADLDPHQVHAPLRAVPAPEQPLLWLSTELPRLQRLAPTAANIVTGLRYLCLNRVFERDRLARFLPGDPPAVTAELIARLAFDLPAPASRPRALDRPFARYA